MKKFLANGFMMSRADKLAIDNDLMISLEEWAMKGPKYMVSKKPVKEIIKTELEKLKEKKQKEGKSLPATESATINEICSMQEFEKKNLETPDLKKPKRKQSVSDKILNNGIEVEDHEHLAANNYWLDAEQLLIDLLDNKIAMCKKRFVEEWHKKLLNDPAVTEIPSDDDDLIELVVKRPDYKNRVQRENNG